jgi:hypothetical protein
MTCPYCGAAHDPKQAGRFCQHCGMSASDPPVSAARTRRAAEAPEEEQRICPSCGVPARSPDTESCLACGGRIPLTETPS